MSNLKKAVILVGHGGLPSDIPPKVVENFMKLHKQRVRAKTPATLQEKELESVIRNWKRTPETDPYKAGLEKLSDHLRPQLEGMILKTAYNEFCYPSIEEAADELAAEGVSKVILVTTMLTPGGSHSEEEIPQEVEDLEKKYPDVEFVYAWPFDLGVFAEVLSNHIDSFTETPSLPES